MLNFLTQIIFCCFLHLRQNHGRNLLWCHGLILALNLDADHWLSSRIYDREGQKFHVFLHGRISKSPTNQTLHIEKGLRWVDRGLIFRSFANQALIICESNIRRGDSVALIIGDNLYPAILKDTNA
mmetsp:Transcript_76632/g.121004  ORF Transcript_76632/g.121004 Transcript_76632/m.121004 type:complete len:126 (+) Transcript_76632:613-990(+)